MGDNATVHKSELAPASTFALSTTLFATREE
jgi:hypothetical protein